ncbi:MAG TPA: hypothetical protein VEZ41_09145, partial [Allosphingosinicella sp.]|nr:hypothetical protein [Allosphingosinicella sp.]
MSWQKRNGKGEYYYSATRYGSRVVKLYMGGGTVAAAAFTLERADRERRQEKHRQQKQERKRADEQ